MSRKWLAPEVVQSSAMDCGPASLKSLLAGFRIRASYGRLREVCQTDVDGTSIDALEEAAAELGLMAEQVMLPRDHFLLAESNSLPALTVVKLPDGATHFVVVWRKAGPWVQVMDPAHGRQHLSANRLSAELYVHTQAVSAGAWRNWFGDTETIAVLRRRMDDAGLGPEGQTPLIARALSDPGWRSLAALDAAVRMLATLKPAGGVPPNAATELVRRLMDEPALIPERHWTVRADPDDPEGLLFTGAVLIRVQGVRPEGRPGASKSAALQRAIEEKEQQPGPALLNTLWPDHGGSAVLLLMSLAAAGAGAAAEALLFRGLLSTAHHLPIGMQRLGAAAAVLVFLAALLALEWPMASGVLRLGRVLDTRLRLRFMAKLPLLSDRYFQSRLSSDMAHRAHTAQALRTAPELAAQLMRALAAMAATLAGIAWLYPESFLWALGAAAAATSIPLLAQPALAERDLRVRTHAGSLSRFFMDALLGLTAIRAHAAERALRHEQEKQLFEWAAAVQRLQRSVASVEGMTLCAAYGAVAALVFSRMNAAEEPASLLLLIYWALSLVQTGQDAAAVAWQIPGLRNIAIRLIEPLTTPEEEQPVRAEGPGPERRKAAPAIECAGVTVRAGGHVILDHVSLHLAPGSHTAIVGSSGAGKSTLAGLLLGWHKPACGRLLLDGEELDREGIERLRQETVWVDPQVQIWNRSLMENLRYGCNGDFVDLEPILSGAELRPVLHKLGNGLQTPLGESGALVSGGEGQRVRFGRGLARRDARLVILDEPGRGLDRGQRRLMIERARRHWAGATLLCITHDISDTDLFERVLVIERGAIVEDGHPRELAGRAAGRYRALLDAEAQVRERLWHGAMWRRVRVCGGRVEEAG